MSLEELDPLSRELLEAAKGSHAPPAAARARLKRRVMAAVFAWGSLAAAWVKVGAAVGVAAVIGSGAYFYARRPTPAVLAPQAVATEQPPPIVAAPEPAPTQAEVTPAPRPENTEHPPSAPRVTKSAAHAPEAVAAPSSIKDETALLFNAHDAVRRGDGARAIDLLDEHARRFPKGALAEERDALRVVALCARGHAAEARASAEAFLAAHPKSPAAARVRASCAFSITDERASPH